MAGSPAKERPRQAGREDERPSSAGQGAAARPVSPSFADEASLLERRQEAMQELREALEALPLEQASLEQALAVLDALRAVPGERLAAGRLEVEGRPLDW